MFFQIRQSLRAFRARAFLQPKQLPAQIFSTVRYADLGDKCILRSSVFDAFRDSEGARNEARAVGSSTSWQHGHQFRLIAEPIPQSAEIRSVEILCMPQKALALFLWENRELLSRNKIVLVVRCNESQLHLTYITVTWSSRHQFLFEPLFVNVADSSTVRVEERTFRFVKVAQIDEEATVQTAQQVSAP